MAVACRQCVARCGASVRRKSVGVNTGLYFEIVGSGMTTLLTIVTRQGERHDYRKKKLARGTPADAFMPEKSVMPWLWPCARF
jgi:hypothetical protein